MFIHRGEVLFSQGEGGDLYCLKSGLLKVVRTHPNGDSVLLNLLLPGEVFPHHSLISSHQYYGTVIAMVTCEVERISSSNWYNTLMEKPEKYKEVAGILQENLRKMQQRIDMITLPAKDRIPYFREWLGIYCKDYPMEDILTQEEIGNFLGMSRETVNRHLRMADKRD